MADVGDILEKYAEVAGSAVVSHLRQLGRLLQGVRVVHVNSTKVGGGVAELLGELIPLMDALGLEAEWEVIEGPADFYETTKAMHNGLQGQQVSIPSSGYRAYEEANEETAERLRPVLENADFVLSLIHISEPTRR